MEVLKHHWKRFALTKLTERHIIRWGIDSGAVY